MLGLRTCHRACSDHCGPGGRAQRFLSYATALPEGHEFIVPPVASNWAELRERIWEMREEADGLIFCGVGEEGCSADFLTAPCPPDLLSDTTQPAVVLGPSRMDHAGAVSFRLKPSLHARIAFDLVNKVLSGIDPRTIPSITPDDLAVFRAEGDPGE